MLFFYLVACTMAGLANLLGHVRNTAFSVSAREQAMRWTETRGGRQLSTKEDFKTMSGWIEGADGSFQSENQGKDGVRKLTCIKDIFTSPDWIQMVTAFHTVPG